MDITEIRVTLRNEERLRGFVNVTFDDAFVVRGMKIIAGDDGYFLAMPSRRRLDGTHQDIAHPVNAEMRRELEEKVLEAFHRELRSQTQL